MFKCLLLYSELKLTARGHSALRDGTYTTLIRKVDKSSIIRQIIDQQAMDYTNDLAHAIP